MEQVAHNEIEGDERSEQIMTMRPARAPIGLCALLIIGSPWTSVAEAAQAATTADLTDYITRMGGWFKKIDMNNDPSAEYWTQASYSVTPPATGSNLTKITMTKYTQQREDTKGICSTDNVTTDTVMIDLRELDTTKTTIDAPAAGGPKIWSVNLVMLGGKPLIRVVTAITPPTIVGFSAGSTNAGTGTTATCPALRNGQQIIATTHQSDVSKYPIEFGDENEAKYLKMLIQSASGSLNPPRLKEATP